MEIKSLIGVNSFILLLCFITVTNGFGFSLLNHLLGIFEKNTNIRANPQITIKSTADIIMKGINSKRCEDALCLDCVPGFCRERPVAHLTSSMNPISLNRNGTINGFPNMTVSAVQTGHAPNTNMSSFNNGLVGTGIQQLVNNNGVINSQNLQNMGSLSNLFNSGSQSSAMPSPTNSSFLSSDYSTTNSTGGPPVITTTTPPKMCMCSWI